MGKNNRNRGGTEHDEREARKQAYEDMVYWKWEGEQPDWSVHSDVGFMEQALRPARGAKVLDLGCGLGQDSVELARRGYEVTALDSSGTFLDVARDRAERSGVSVEFVRGDMVELPFEGVFDAVVLWGNTFAMLEHEENVEVLAGIARALKKGGRALIDTQNYSSLPEETKDGWHFHADDPGLLMLIKGTKDIMRARFGFTVTAIDLAGGKRHEMPFSWRLYYVPELKQMIAEAGLSLSGIYGDDPEIADWKNWERGQPCPYCPEAFTEKAAKRIVLCET